MFSPLHSVQRLLHTNGTNYYETFLANNTITRVQRGWMGREDELAATGVVLLEDRMNGDSEAAFIVAQPALLLLAQQTHRNTCNNQLMG